MKTEIYYGEEAALRSMSLPTAQAIDLGKDYIRTIYINTVSKTKYEYIINKGDDLDIRKCVLKVTKNCDVDKELAECQRINLIFNQRRFDDNYMPGASNKDILYPLK